jgi:heme-binding protein
MVFISLTRRRAIASAISTGAIASAMLLCGVPSALADPAPGCTAADFDQVAANVKAAKAAYLFQHPDVNTFFTGLKGQPKDQRRTQVENYLTANPQTKTELAAIRQPIIDLKNRCQ